MLGLRRPTSGQVRLFGLAPTDAVRGAGSFFPAVEATEEVSRGVTCPA
jgi:hypothetical protein